MNLESDVTQDTVGRGQADGQGIDNRVFPSSSVSVFSGMEKFIKAVNNMESTIMVPSRLIDVTYSDYTAPQCLGETDCYDAFKNLKDVRNLLLWGPRVKPSAATVPSDLSDSRKVKCHSRKSSSISSASSASVSDSETDSCVDDQADDSGVEIETDSSKMEQKISPQYFYEHLTGLMGCLTQYTTAADFITKRYQESVGSLV